ncbi:MAG TPA: YggT family protein [Steroidobacteraceae bacterium]|nr:YggT family protein [Steroidobacteraceae bacterium]
MEAILYIVRALLWLAVFAFLLRVILQLVRADFRNAIAQAIVRVTNPLVLPLRRVIPPIGKFDAASLVALLLVELAAAAILLALGGFPLDPAGLVRFALIDLLQNVLQFFLVAIIIYVLLSWIAPGTYSPAGALLASICEPLLAPVRRVIPPIGGLDLSALFVLIGLQALLILLR